MGLTKRYAAARASSASAQSSRGEVLESGLQALFDVAIPEFCDWCAVDIADETGRPQPFAVRHRIDLPGPEGPPGLSPITAPAPRDVELAAIIERVFESGHTSVWQFESPAGLARCVVVNMRVNERPYGTITFALDEGSSGYGFLEVTAAEEVAWSTAAVIERGLLHHEARESVRRTQRIASQLHQLIAVSIAVAGLRGEPEILMSLVNSTRSVFDADTAYVSLETGPVAPLHVIGQRGKAALVLNDEISSHLGHLPTAQHGGVAPWRDHDWLVAPILERRSRVRGVMAIRRTSGATFGPEDKEVLTLLTQVASRSIDAVELSRTIQKSEARWRILVESAPVGIIEVDAAGAVRWWNRAASRTFAWPEYAETSNAMPPVIPEAARERLSTLWAEVLGGAAPSSHDIVDVEIAGRRRDLTASAALLPSGEGETRSLLTLVGDVTDQRELKLELRHAHRMEIRGQVASSVAHDFNNLLTLISGYAEILAQDVQTDSRAHQMVEDIQATAYRASMLTRQLQTIGRTKPPEPVVLDPTAVIESNAEVLERIVGVDVQLIWSLDVHSRNIRVDADQFEQMILNLALNARDAMPLGGQLDISVDEMRVRAEQEVDLGVHAGAFIHIAIRDNGVGMDEETRRQCFEPLFTTKGPFKGTGLGLAAARRLVEESGGAIRCSSTPGEGSTFDIFLPIVNAAATEDVVHVNEIDPRGSATVLIAEDDEGLRRLMGQVLRRNGYHVLEASSAEQAMQIAEASDDPIDLLLSDVLMGGVSGPELGKYLQAASPTLRVLLVSGTANETVLSDLLPETCAFLAKPFKPSELVHQIHELLSRRH